MDIPETRVSAAWERLTAANCGRGDAPFWHPKEERLYWLDTALRRIWRLHVPSGRSEMWELGQEPGSLAPCRSGALLMALHDGIYRSQTWHDIPQKIANAPYDAAHQHFGNGKCDPWGRFWVGTAVAQDASTTGGLYCLHKLNRPQPELRLIAGGVQVSNGLAWSPDGRTQYWSDSARQQIHAYPLVTAGQYPPVLGTPLTLATFTSPTDDPRPEQPGGAAVDQKGNYWVAVENGMRVLCLSPHGDVLANLVLPTRCPTAVCFGGHDLRTLYVTTMRAHRGQAELRDYPDSGAVFALRVDTPGLPVNFYDD